MKITIERLNKTKQVDCDCVFIGYSDGEGHGGFVLSDVPVSREDVEMCEEWVRFAARSVIGREVE